MVARRLRLQDGTVEDDGREPDSGTTMVTAAERPGRGARASAGGNAGGGARRRANAAVRAEPGGIGTSGARDPLRREVKLLGSLLGQVIAEQSGSELLELVERIRRLAIGLRRTDDPVERRRMAAELELALRSI